MSEFPNFTTAYDVATDGATVYYKFKGILSKEVDGNDALCSPEECQAIIRHLFTALDGYAHDGFRFVDPAFGATLSTAAVEMEWSNYGLTEDLVQDEDRD